MGAGEENGEETGAVGTPDYIAPEVLMGTGCGSCFFLSLITKDHKHYFKRLDEILIRN